MYSYIELNKIIPSEINFFKKIVENEKDPIKREIFSFGDLTYIMEKINKFPVKSDNYYSLIGDKKLKLLSLLALNYILYKENKNGSNITNLEINPKDFYHCISFIDIFFDYDIPIKDNLKENIIWIFPKLSIKNFISNSIISNYYKDYYFEEDTLNKLIMIMSSFAQYEYKNCDTTIMNQFQGLNYPTLVLANISLYEKGYLKILDEDTGISIMLDANGRKDTGNIFTKDEKKIKESILNIINTMESIQYSINDFS
ncbi:hypothetical protein CLPU_5c02540 [Gottschalkia purinilytica]|uniref:Uncharacterized protein n=1 Tax=Gottschalkia purinilytica TaxID=1503 RepID=A0A0L0WBV4_GOTPU|nr:hypothetical protein [Gottschalkia purinilytica]KNF08947.1 hypothetical protein CLPU_5c02540 [Gottschalkia purinilytica]